MHNPLRSEADAFRWFVVVLGGAIAIGALAALTRPIVGVIFAALLIFVVTPALAASRADHWASDIDEAIVLARQRMELSVIEIEQRLQLKARGEIGDSDPNVAIGDALRVFPADEIVISTHPAATSRWLEGGVVDRARQEIDLPITHVVVDLAAERTTAR